MIVKVCVVVGADIAAGEDFFEVLEELSVDGHDVFEVTVDGAILHHEDLAVALDDLSLDLAGLFVLEDLDGEFAVDDLVADVGDALGAKGVRCAGPAERRLGLLEALKKRLVGPLRSERGIRVDRIQFFKDGPGSIRGERSGLFNDLYSFGHSLPL